MPSPDLHVILVPGFFGFSSIGEMRYFEHVRRVLREACSQRGVLAHFHEATPPPTGALARRAAHLANRLAEVCAQSDAPVHIVGHSTGGLDGRMLLSPGVNLPTDADLAAILPRVRSLVSVATPHHGAPLARTLARAQGERLLAAISILTLHVVRLDAIAVAPMQMLTRALTGASSVLDLDPSLLDSVWEGVLADFDPARREELRAFFGEVRQDRSLLPQLTPEGLDGLRDQLQARAGVHYGSVITRARSPQSTGLAAALPSHPSWALYRTLHRLSGWVAPPDAPPLPSTQAAVTEAAWGIPPKTSSNDGIVPTRAMYWGQLVHAAWADHLDCLGFFTGREPGSPHVDWLRTGSGFSEAGFREMWHAVLGFMLAASGPGPGATGNGQVASAPLAR